MTGCRKRRYPSRKVAKKVLRSVHDRNHTYAGVRAYHCDACDGWHLGHLPPRVIAGHVSRGQVYA